jgi:hypothetical protein
VAGMSIWVLVVGKKNQEIDNLMLNCNPLQAHHKNIHSFQRDKSFQYSSTNQEEQILLVGLSTTVVTNKTQKSLNKTRNS